MDLLTENDMFDEDYIAPSKTYKMDLEGNRVQGYTDEQEAMRQVIFKILQTERYQHNKIYSDNYGVELKELIGQPIAWVIPEAERRITEALTWDDRIKQVTNFEFSEGKKGNLLVKFTAVTIFGSVDTAVEVML